MKKFSLLIITCFIVAVNSITGHATNDINKNNLLNSNLIDTTENTNIDLLNNFNEIEVKTNDKDLINTMNEKISITTNKDTKDLKEKSKSTKRPNNKNNYNKKVNDVENNIKEKETKTKEEKEVNKYHLPLDEIASYTSNFGYRTDPITGKQKYHSGVDIPTDFNTSVYATENGTVVTATYDEDGYGYYIKIEHENNYSTLYAHCNELLVNVGDTVTVGQEIAKSGSTGRSTGPHLHFEYLKDNTAINPDEYLKQGGKL